MTIISLMQLGADARFFSSLTKEEQERVDLIIQLLEIEANNQADEGKEGEQEKTAPPDPNSMADALIRDEEKMRILDTYVHGYIPDIDNRQRLLEIDR